MRAVSSAQMPEVWRAAIIMAAALAIAFLLGGAAGYSVRALAPVGSSQDASNPVAACTAGSHPAVYYTAHAWSCVSD